MDKYKESDSKGFPVRLGEMKRALQTKAEKEKRSLHNYLLFVIYQHWQQLKETDKDCFK